MAPGRKHLGLLIALVLVASGCTDARPNGVQVQMLSTLPPGTYLVPAASVQFNQQPTNAMQMSMNSTGSLFMTGTPFGFSRWETSQDQENPTLTFAASDQLPTFSPMGSWIFNYYASNALAIWGNVAFMSGTVGMSVVSLNANGSSQYPVEVQRYPTNSNTNTSLVQQTNVDPSYIYAAAITHPTLPILYGFSRQDYLYTMSIGQGSVTPISQDAYGSSGQNVCCAMGAAVFGNRVFAAFRNQLLFWNMDGSGNLTNASYAPELNAVNVQATNRYLYVQHEPTGATGSTAQFPPGIYVFDTNGNSVTYFAASSPTRFVVSPDDTHLYSNTDGQTVSIFRIQWTN